jgi:hypothetical protein
MTLPKTNEALHHDGMSTNHHDGKLAVVLPVQVHGLQRAWTKRVHRRRRLHPQNKHHHKKNDFWNMTAVGINYQNNGGISLPDHHHQQQQHPTNTVGVLIPIPKSASSLQALDERERGYDRRPIFWNDIRPIPYLHPDVQAQTQEILHTLSLQQQQPPHVWVYVPQTSMPPSSQYPIVQSYIDTIVRGCLEYDEQMAMEFLTKTLGWYPLYDNSYPNETDSSDEIPMEHNNGSNPSKSNSTGMTMTSSSSSSAAAAAATTTANQQTNNERFVTATIPADSTTTTTTTTTMAPILDDRHDPIYIRGDPEWSRQNAIRIDAILEHVRPDLLACRREFTSSWFGCCRATTITPS